MSFWQQLNRPFTALAPMEAVSDTVFRHVVAQAAAPDVWFTEFTNATGWAVAGEPAIGTRLVKGPDERPIVAQLWGADPESMAKLAQHCADLGFDGVDLNTGCPDAHAIKSGGGAALIKNPALTSELIAALRTSGLPVSVKCRLGYSRLDEWETWIGHLLSHNLDALTVHLRTKREMSKVPAHWELMAPIVALRDRLAPQTVILGNGDVANRSQGEALVQDTGCDGVMIGRGVFTNPFCFEAAPQPHTRQELMDLLYLQLNLHDQLSQSHGERKFEPLKRFFKIYIRDFEGATDLRTSLMLTRSTNEARELLATAAHQTEPSPIIHPTSMATAHYQIKRPGAIRAIIFDSDGTLLDTRRFIMEGYMTILNRHGLGHLADESYIRQNLGKPVPQTYAAILGKQASQELVAQLSKEHDECQDQLLRLIKPYPHTEAMLREWRHRGIKLCLFTSGNRRMIERNFRAAGLPAVDSLFDAIITADDNLPHKPAPDAVNALLTRVAIPANEAVLVGDHPYDMQSGTRAEVMATIGVLHGLGTSDELTAAGANHLAKDLLEVSTISHATLPAK